MLLVIYVDLVYLYEKLKLVSYFQAWASNGGDICVQGIFSPPDTVSGKIFFRRHCRPCRRVFTVLGLGKGGAGEEKCETSGRVRSRGRVKTEKNRKSEGGREICLLKDSSMQYDS